MATTLSKKATTRKAPKKAQTVDIGGSATIREGDCTSRFRFTDKHGNLGKTFLGADLFDMFHVPEAFVRQINDEWKKVVNAIQEWAKKWQNQIKGWELSPRKGAMQNYCYFQFVVTQKGTEYNRKLAEALSQLDSHLYNDIGCSLVRVTTLMVPDVPEEDVAKIWA